jgi:putative transposase
MVDENDTNAANENMEVEPPVAASEPKKQRAKRRTPAELAAVATAKSARGKRRAKAAAVEASQQTAAGKASAKSDAPTRAEPREAPSATVDEFAELLQLEEENKGLRKALAEKLRAENSDLRKRLGQAS